MSNESLPPLPARSVFCASGRMQEEDSFSSCVGGGLAWHSPAGYRYQKCIGAACYVGASARAQPGLLMGELFGPHIGTMAAGIPGRVSIASIIMPSGLAIEACAASRERERESGLLASTNAC